MSRPTGSNTDVRERQPLGSEPPLLLHVIGGNLADPLGVVPESTPFRERSASQQQLAGFLEELVVQVVDRSQILVQIAHRTKLPRPAAHMSEGAIDVDHRQSKPPRPTGCHARCEADVVVHDLTQPGERSITHPQHRSPLVLNSPKQAPDHGVAIPRDPHVETIERPVVPVLPTQGEVDDWPADIRRPAVRGKGAGGGRRKSVGRDVVIIRKTTSAGNVHVPTTDAEHVRAGRNERLLPLVLHQTDGALEGELSEYRHRPIDISTANGALGGNAHHDGKQVASKHRGVLSGELVQGRTGKRGLSQNGYGNGQFPCGKFSTKKIIFYLFIYSHLKI